MEFIFSKKARMVTMILMALGVVGIIGGYIAVNSNVGHVHHGHVGTMQEWWSNLLVCGFFFFAIALGGLFFYALQYAAEVGWTSQLKRIFEAVFHRNVMFFGGVLLVVFIGASLHQHHTYHWMDESTFAEFATLNESGIPIEFHETQVEGSVANPSYDYLIAGKSAYLNQGFWWIRTLVYIGCFIYFSLWFRKKSLEEDETEGTTVHFKMFKRSAIFLVLFAVFSTTIAWDWLMSIDTHWFSTMYGWYVFSGMWVTFMIFATLVVLYLKEKGHLPHVNQSHIHDMGKWMFAISMLWSYLGLCQFLLIWYADIPEETPYYLTRFQHYGTPFIFMCVVNFALPFFMLIARDAKRNWVFLRLAGFLILIGHYIDVYLLVMPGTMHGDDHYSWWQPLMFLGFLGVFLYLMLNALSKAPLIPKNHPFLDESEHHHI